jgi:succinate dehydrogenase/fumarate reductase flavoprotein subunit
MKNSNKNFEIEGQSITLERKIHDYQQVLLGGGEKNQCFTFQAEINQTEGKLIIGVVDQLAQKEKISSYNSGNAICCGGVSNRIWFVHNGKCQYRGTGVRLRSGMKVSVEVNLPRQTVTFTIKEGDETHEFKQQSDILKESHR